MDSVKVCEEIYGALLQCAVCKSRLKQPKVLPYCSHVFCRGCLESVLRVSRGKLLCPTCRADNTSAVLDGTVDSLADGHFINKLGDIVSRHRDGPGNANRHVLFSSARHGSASRGLAGASEIRSADGFNRSTPPQLECPVCSMRFHDLELLQSHAEVCTDDQYGGFFTCPNCSNVYLTNDIFTIQAHLVDCMPDVSITGNADHQHQPGGGARGRRRENREWFMCPSCDAICDDMASMEVHVAIHHGQESPAPSQSQTNSSEGDAGRSPSNLILASHDADDDALNNLAGASEREQKSENPVDSPDTPNHLYASVASAGYLEASDVKVELDDGYLTPVEPSVPPRTLQNQHEPTPTSRHESKWKRKLRKCIIS